jgi:hypothetical protein
MDTISLFSTSFLDELEKIAKRRAQFPKINLGTPVTPAPTPKITLPPVPSFRVKLASTQTPPSTPTQTLPPGQIPTFKQRVNMGIRHAWQRNIIQGQKPTVSV